MQKHNWPSPSSSVGEYENIGSTSDAEHVIIPNDGTDVWEIDSQHLKFEYKIASGSYGDL